MSDATLVIRRVNGMRVTSSIAVPAPPPSGPDRIAALDGLRGVAILLVLLHNDGGVSGGLTNLALKLYASLATAPGWWAVQLFFALSGFLITRILLRPQTGSLPHDLGTFYARRMLRIFPLYYAVLAFCMLAGRRDLMLWYFTYTYNLKLYLLGD